MDRGKRGLKRSVVVDGRGIPMGSVTAPANRHGSPLLVTTLEAARALGMVLEGATIHLDRGYDSKPTRLRLLEFGLVAEISRKGRFAPLNATRRWVIERTNVFVSPVGISAWYFPTCRPCACRRNHRPYCSSWSRRPFRPVYES